MNTASNQQYKQLTVSFSVLDRIPMVKPIGALLLSSILCCGLVAARFVELNSLKYGFLIWNLFLAWIPLFCALLLSLKWYPQGYLSMPKSIIQTKEKAIFILLISSWLLFFPNAPYIVSGYMNQNTTI